MPNAQFPIVSIYPCAKEDQQVVENKLTQIDAERENAVGNHSMPTHMGTEGGQAAGSIGDHSVSTHTGTKDGQAAGSAGEPAWLCVYERCQIRVRAAPTRVAHMQRA